MSKRFLAKMSKSGYDVKSCGYNELLFTSEFPLLKKHAEGEGTVHIEPVVGVESVEIDHSVGVAPMFFAKTQWADPLAGVWYTSYKQFSFSNIVPDPGGLLGYFQALAYTDAQHLYLSWATDLQDPINGTDVNYQYIIFEDPISE
jgi:hypothetical protein